MEDDAYPSSYIYDWIEAGVEIEDNGVRTTDAKYRELIDLTIKHITKENLDNFKNFGIISGTTEHRIEQFKSYLGL